MLRGLSLARQAGQRRGFKTVATFDKTKIAEELEKKPRPRVDPKQVQSTFGPGPVDHGYMEPGDITYRGYNSKAPGKSYVTGSPVETPNSGTFTSRTDLTKLTRSERISDSAILPWSKNPAYTDDENEAFDQDSVAKHVHVGRSEALSGTAGPMPLSPAEIASFGGDPAGYLPRRDGIPTGGGGHQYKHLEPPELTRVDATTENLDDLYAILMAERLEGMTHRGPAANGDGFTAEEFGIRQQQLRKRQSLKMPREDDL